MTARLLLGFVVAGLIPIVAIAAEWKLLVTTRNVLMYVDLCLISPSDDVAAGGRKGWFRTVNLSAPSKTQSPKKAREKGCSSTSIASSVELHASNPSGTTIAGLRLILGHPLMAMPLTTRRLFRKRLVRPCWGQICGGHRTPRSSQSLGSTQRPPSSVPDTARFRGGRTVRINGRVRGPAYLSRPTVRQATMVVSSQSGNRFSIRRGRFFFSSR